MKSRGWVVVAGALFACESSGSAGGAAGNGAADAGEGDTGADARADGAFDGGGSGGSGGSGATAGAAGDAEPPLVDPDADEPCVVDPQPAAWSEEAVSFAELGAQSVQATAAVGGGVTLLLGQIVVTPPSVEPDARLYATASRAAGAWSEPVLLSAAPDLFYRPVLHAARDGSGGIAVWAEDGGSIRYATWSAAAGWSRAAPFAGASGEPRDAVALPGGRYALLGMPMTILSGDSSSDVPPPNGARRMFAGPGDTAVVYATPALGGSTRNAYSFDSGFAAPEAVPAMASSPAAWQEFWFEGPTGMGARVVRQWMTPETEGLHVTVRRGEASWTDEQRITSSDGQSSSRPSVAVAGGELLVLWADARVVERAYDTAWGAEQPLARSSSLELHGVAGTSIGAGLVGTFPHEGRTVSKLFRRGDDGTWYCPRLARHGFNPTVTGDQAGELLFVGAQAARAELVRFRP